MVPTIGFYAPDNLHGRIQEEAAKERRTVSNYVRIIVEDYLNSLSAEEGATSGLIPETDPEWHHPDGAIKTLGEVLAKDDEPNGEDKRAE